MKLRIFQIDAFTTDVFAGNPAAVCPLEDWLEASRMQAIARENNLSETAFFVPTKEGYDLRWFTPTTEVELCGHATLASGYVIFNYLEDAPETIRFSTRSGPLTVERRDDLLAMNFPMRTPERCLTPPSELAHGLGRITEQFRRSEKPKAQAITLPCFNPKKRSAGSFQISLCWLNSAR